MLVEKKTGNILLKYQRSFNNNIALVADSKKGLRPQAVFDFISLSGFSFPFVEEYNLIIDWLQRIFFIYSRKLKHLIWTLSTVRLIQSAKVTAQNIKLKTIAVVKQQHKYCKEINNLNVKRHSNKVLTVIR